MATETLLADVKLINSGDIEAYGDAIAAIGINVDLTNSGDLKSEGWNGIVVWGEGDATVDNTGSIKAISKGIDVEAAGEATIENAGDIDVGNMNRHGDADGILVLGLEGASIENHGDVNAYDRALVACGAGVSVINMGDLNSAAGIIASSIAGEAVGSETDSGEAFIISGGSTVVENSGNINLVGQQLVGTTYTYQGHYLYVNSVGIYGSAVNGLISKDDDGSGSVFKSLDDAPQLDVTITNLGNITKSPDSTNGSHDTYSSSEGNIGIAALAEDKITITNSGIIDVTWAGIHALGNGDISITNSGEINVANVDGGFGGIKANSGLWTSGALGKSVEITNTAKIIVDGDHMRGIRGNSNGGDVKVTNEEVIATQGERSIGICILRLKCRNKF